MATDDFYIVKSWMIDDLGLSGVELQCFAIIWSLSRGKKQMYIAGNSHLIRMTKKTEPTVLNALKSLCEKGYIKKIPVVVNNIERKYYKAISEGLNNFSGDDEEGLNNFSGTPKKIIPPNKESNNESKNKKGENNKSFSPKNKRFVKPTIKQIEEYIKEKEMHFEAERFFDYYESKGWMVGKSPMKDWKAACRTWESQRKHEFKEEQTEESGIVYPDGMDEQKWTNTTYWLCSYCRKIAGKISPTEFVDYKKRCGGDSKLLSRMLIKINSYVELHGQVGISEKLDELLQKHKDNEQETGD